MTSPNPLTPRAANKLPPGTPNRLASKMPVTLSPLKLKASTTPAAAPPPDSPFASFSLSVIRGLGSASPQKSAFKSRSFDADDVFGGGGDGAPAAGGDPFGDDEEEDVTVCSNFSDLTTAAAYKTRSPAKNAAPQTPGRRESPVKGMATPRTVRTAVADAATPRTMRTAAEMTTPRTVRTAAGAPNTAKSGDNTQNLLLDFTTQFEGIARPKFPTPTGHSHRRTQSASPRKGSPAKAAAAAPATPTESRFFNLLDFTPGPVATPRSIPSITPREVEELKAGFNSQVSLLTAQLSGREVEVTGLRTAVQETETRCAELSNNLKEQNSRFDEERNEWERVKTEMGELFEAEKSEKESISTLLTEKEQVVENLHSELEGRDTEVKNLKKRLRDTEDELERTREEVIRVKTDASVTAAAAANAAPITPPAPAPSTDGTVDEETAKKTQEEVERVARELHTLYKAKHETKVAALKKSYESRWEKKVAALQQQVEALTVKNDELTNKLEEKSDNAFPAAATAESNDTSANAGSGAGDDPAELKRRFEELQKELEAERQEKKDIVVLVEELLAIQAATAPPAPAPPPAVAAAVEEKAARPSAAVGGLRNGIAMMGKGAKRAEQKASATTIVKRRVGVADEEVEPEEREE